MTKSIHRNGILGLAGLVLAAAFLSWILDQSEEYNAKANAKLLKELGYETHILQKKCFAKHDEKWVLCKFIVSNLSEWR